MSIYILIAAIAIAAFIAGWCVGLHLPYYHRPSALLRKRYLIFRRKWMKRKLPEKHKKVFDYMIENGWGDQ